MKCVFKRTPLKYVLTVFSPELGTFVYTGQTNSADGSPIFSVLHYKAKLFDTEEAARAEGIENAVVMNTRQLSRETRRNQKKYGVNIGAYS